MRRLVSGEKTITPSYKCTSPPHGCGKVQIKAAFVEDLVVCAVLYRLEQRPKIVQTVSPPNDAPDRLVAAYDRYATAIRKLATDYYVEHRITREEWFTARDGLEQQLNAARRLLEPGWKQPPIRRPSARFRSDWDSLDFDHKRDIVASELRFASITRAPRNGVLDVSRVIATWWDDEPQLSSTPWTVTRTLGVDAWDCERWIGTKEVAALLGLPYAAIGRMVRAGELPAVRLGSAFRFKRDDVTNIVGPLVGALGTAEAAKRLGVSRWWLTDQIRRGHEPAAKRGKRYYLQPSDVAELAHDLDTQRSQLIGVKDALYYLGIPRSALYRMIRSGQLTASRHGRWYQFRRDEIQAAAEKRFEARKTDDSITSREAASMLHVCDVTVHQLIREGHLTATKVNRHWRIQRSSLPKAAGVVRARSPWPHHRDLVLATNAV